MNVYNTYKTNIIFIFNLYFIGEILHFIAIILLENDYVTFLLLCNNIFINMYNENIDFKDYALTRL